MHNLIELPNGMESHNAHTNIQRLRFILYLYSRKVQPSNVYRGDETFYEPTAHIYLVIRISFSPDPRAYKRLMQELCKSKSGIDAIG